MKRTSVSLALSVLLLSLLVGSVHAQRQREPTDGELLNATPIARNRMELIWLEPPRLQELSTRVEQAGGRLITEYYDRADDDRREYEITTADIDWAKKIEKVVDFAYEAGQRGDFGESIRYYRQALQLAPGGDLFLMSVGVAYVQLGEKERGLRFLERAAEISPTNGRIRRNLEAARGY